MSCKNYNRLKFLIFQSILGLAMIVLLIISCQHRPKYVISDNQLGHSIIDIEYINDTLDINLVDFRVVKIDSTEYEIQIYVITSDPEKYQSDDYKYFVHLYPVKDSEASKNFVSLGTDRIEAKEDYLIYSRKFKMEREYFEQIRYGLLDKNKKRLFTLVLDSVNLK